MAANGELGFAFLAIPASVFASLIGFLALNQGILLLQNITTFLKASDIDLLRQSLYPPFKVLTSQFTSVFGTRFSPNATHVLLGAVIVVMVITRQRS
jgi:hypothetical protein